MKNLEKITINCRNGMVFIIDDIDIIKENFDYNLNSIINNITFIIEDSIQYRKRLLLKLISVLYKQNKIMYIGKRDLLINNIIYKNITATDINSLTDIIKNNNIEIIMINDFQYLFNDKSNKVFSLLKNLEKDGITIVVALKMSNVDEIIFQLIESIGSIILVAKK